MKTLASSTRTLVIAAAFALAALGLGSVAHATRDRHQKIKPRQMTCRDFLALGTEDQPRVVYWLEGYSKSGKPEDAEIDLDSLQRPVAMVVTECRQAPKATLWQKLKRHL